MLGAEQARLGTMAIVEASGCGGEEARNRRSRPRVWRKGVHS